MQTLEDYSLLTDSQHGFRTNNSCETQLLTLVDELLQGVTKRKQNDLAIIDFNQTFDVVLQKHLIEKLQYYGIEGQCLD